MIASQLPPGRGLARSGGNTCTVYCHANGRLALAALWLGWGVEHIDDVRRRGDGGGGGSYTLAAGRRGRELCRGSNCTCNYSFHRSFHHGTRPRCAPPSRPDRQRCGAPLRQSAASKLVQRRRQDDMTSTSRSARWGMPCRIRSCRPKLPPPPPISPSRRERREQRERLLGHGLEIASLPPFPFRLRLRFTMNPVPEPAPEA